MPRGKSHAYVSFQAFSTIFSPSCLSWVENGLLERNGQHKWKRTNMTLEGVSRSRHLEGSRYPGQLIICARLGQTWADLAKLVNFNSVSQFCHFGDETGFTLKSHHMRRVTFWVLWVLITKLKRIKENYHKQFHNAFTGRTVKTVNCAFYCKCLI